MAQRLVRAAWAALLVLACIATAAVACGPYFPEAVFVESSHPDSPLENYAVGKLGIVQPGYGTSYLAVAYRYFSGVPFDAAEQNQLLTLWNQYYDPQQAGQSSGRSEWDATRDEFSQVPRSSASLDPGDSVVYAPIPDKYESFANCLDDAFQTAAKTLKDRAEQFGAQSEVVTSWLAAQDMVFQNCELGGVQDAVLPTAADAGLPQIIQKDRDYQIAAAYFYAGKWTEAKKRFQAISADSSSPWNATAALVAIRCDIREATLSTDDPVDRNRKLAAANAGLKAIIANPAFASVKAGAESLRGFVEFRADPAARMLELSKIIEARTAPGTLRQNLDDYSHIRISQAILASAREQSDMTDWIYAFKGGVDTETKIVARWQVTHSPAWLVAALTYAQADTPRLADLLAAANAVPANSPAYLTVAFHRNRLLAAQGQNAQARLEVDKVLALPDGDLSASARNLFLALRMKMAKDFDEFLQFAPRVPAVVTYGEQSNPPPPEPIFDADAAIALTQNTPTHLLVDAASSPRLPGGLKRQVAQAAWVRAILLDQEQIARQLVPVLSSLAPDMAPALKTYADAPSAPERTFAAVVLMLHHPESHPYVSTGVGRQTDPGEIDSYRDNWWCTFTPPPYPGSSRYQQNYYQLRAAIQRPLVQIYPDGKITSPQFITAADRQAAEKEWAAIAQISGASTWLGKQVLDWANAHPEDPRVPEALHLVVTASRVGCTDADSGDYSRKAFTLLHTRYPQSEWTAQTPYWFN